MEYSLHKSLKEVYCDEGAQLEVVFGDYRIDVVDGSGLLIEIQHGSLSAIKRKCHALLRKHKMLVVKPVIRKKQLVKLSKRNGKVTSSRKSPKTGDWISVFDELVYFAKLVSHANLTMEFVMVDIVERRFPGHGKRRWRRDSDFQVDDLELVEVIERICVREVTDLLQLLPHLELPDEFDTQELATAIGKRRHIARRVAYSLREAGAIKEIGKRGNAKLYRRVDK